MKQPLFVLVPILSSLPIFKLNTMPIRKVDIFLKDLRGFKKYECSTITDKTLKQVAHNFRVRHCLDVSQVSCAIDHNYNP